MTEHRSWTLSPADTVLQSKAPWFSSTAANCNENSFFPERTSSQHFRLAVSNKRTKLRGVTSYVTPRHRTNNDRSPALEVWRTRASCSIERRAPEHARSLLHHDQPWSEDTTLTELLPLPDPSGKPGMYRRKLLKSKQCISFQLPLTFQYDLSITSTKCSFHCPEILPT